MTSTYKWLAEVILQSNIVQTQDVLFYCIKSTLSVILMYSLPSSYLRFLINGWQDSVYSNTVLSSHKASPFKEMHSAIVLISWIIGHYINGFSPFNSEPHFDCPDQILNRSFGFIGCNFSVLAAQNTSQTVVQQYISGATKVAKESTNYQPRTTIHLIAVIDYQMISSDRATSNRWYCNVEMMTFCPYLTVFHLRTIARTWHKLEEFSPLQPKTSPSL